MAIPAYLWLKDDGGALIKGSVDVRHRDESIEFTSFSHNLYIPADGTTGKLTGTRVRGAPGRGEDCFSHTNDARHKNCDKCRSP